MATNPYINNWTEAGEQSLLNDLMIEAIQMWGFDIVYAPRQLVKLDELYREDTVSKFITGVTVEVYIKSAGGFEGAGDLLSKFGLDIQDSVTFEMSRTRFAQTVTDIHSTIVRPREGDLIWMPAPFNKLWEIKFVEHEEPFYQIGQLVKYVLKCEKFRYSHERLETGVANLDAIAGDHGYALTMTLGAGSGTFANNEYVYQGSWPTATLASGRVVSWNSGTKALTVQQVTGTFAADKNVIGVTSGAAYVLVADADAQDNTTDAIQDNVYLEDQVADVVDFTESNPFSE